jgi:hypothetical protein
MLSNRRFGVFSSSADPEKLGKTVQGLIMGAGTVLILILNMFHITVGSEELNTVAVNIGGLITALLVAYGLVQKLFVWAIDKWQNRTV